MNDTAARLGITMLDDAADVGPWPDEGIAAIVSFGEHIALDPGLDEGLRTDVLAMALIVAAVMGDCDTGHPCAITAPGGHVLISRTCVTQPGPGPGPLATLLARRCGRDTPSAAFEYTAPHRLDGSWEAWASQIWTVSHRAAVAWRGRAAASARASASVAGPG